MLAAIQNLFKPLELYQGSPQMGQEHCSGNKFQNTPYNWALRKTLFINADILHFGFDEFEHAQGWRFNNNDYE